MVSFWRDKEECMWWCAWWQPSIMLSGQFLKKLPIFVLFAKSPANPSSALISVAVVVKPWFEAEKMFFFTK